jgi:succinate-semialdehyde dehydrogenase/glutarate-semialdehyde dehydrogenase
VQTVDPTTGRPRAGHAEHDDAAVARALAVAAQAFLAWRDVPHATRAALLGAVGERLAAHRESLARLITSEMGKPIAQAEAEVDKCAWACRWHAEHAARHLAPEPVATEAARSYVRFDPLGTVLAIMPWNFPLWQVFRAAAPAIAAGNAVVLKHAAIVPGCALAVEALFREAGAPAGLFTTMILSPARAEALIDRPEIAAVTLTGSEGAGEAIARRAGAALKKCVLELGGSDAFVVLADADLERTVEQAVNARLVCNGESCIAAKRFIVEEPLAERFERAFAERMAAVPLGDPMDRAVRLGPLARADLRDALHALVQRSVAQGARLATGGHPLDRPGFFYAPTVLTHVAPGMAVFEEETFGPVAAVVRARDAAHAVELANASRYGLGASVWTRDPTRGEALAAALAAGSVFVNETVKSDPRLPFGGIKRSGHGRELSAFGLREFVNVKTVWVG